MDLSRVRKTPLAMQGASAAACASSSDEEDLSSSAASTASSSVSPQPPPAALAVVPEPVPLSGRRWHYRGEGGANLVISLPGDRTVVRFAKSKYAGKDQDQKIGEMAYFANEVMRPLLGETLVRPVRTGVVSEEDFETVRRQAQPFRPLNRCKKDINSRRVILAPDCVFLTEDYQAGTAGDTISVEIKPKQGWHSLKATCAVDLCHRCLKQHAKVFRGEIDNISAYCPLDLFSGDRARMKRAIFDLYENPNNRFKLFLDGRTVYTESIGELGDAEEAAAKFFGMDEELQNGTSRRHPLKKKGSPEALDMLAALLCSALLAPLEKGGTWDVDEELVHLSLSSCAPRPTRRGATVCDTASLPLPPGSVLQKLLTLQRHTDISDHGARDLCERLLSNVEDVEGLHRLVLWHPNAKLEHQLSQQEIEDVIQLQRFLLSVTAKDVSLLITFREVVDKESCDDNRLFNNGVLDGEDCGGGACGSPPPPRSLPSFRFASAGGRLYRAMISVIDLDPKPVHRISTWVKRKEEWLETYFSSIGNG